MQGEKRGFLLAGTYRARGGTLIRQSENFAKRRKRGNKARVVQACRVPRGLQVGLETGQPSR